MSTIEGRFRHATRHLPRENAYLAGVSGGRDSVVLLHLLQKTGFTNICVCHLDHGTRKETGQADLRFTQNLAERSNMRFIYDKLPDFGPFLPSENALRDLRFAFFAAAAARIEAEGVFLGHHSDDAAETVLWNLLRGSGSQGLCGIPFSSEIQTDAGPIRVYRPMLDIGRREIDEMVEKHSLAFVEDATNQSLVYTRNRLRREVIPWLEETLGRNVRQSLLRSASILADENEYLDSLASVPDWKAPLSVEFLKSQPAALQRRIFLKWLQFHQIKDAGFAEVELLRALLDVSTGPARCNLPGDRQARRRAGKISLAWQTEGPV